LLRLRDILSYLVELALFKTSIRIKVTFLVMLIDNFLKEFVENVVSELYDSTNDWV